MRELVDYLFKGEISAHFSSEICSQLNISNKTTRSIMFRDIIVFFQSDILFFRLPQNLDQQEEKIVKTILSHTKSLYGGERTFYLSVIDGGAEPAINFYWTPKQEWGLFSDTHEQFLVVGDDSVTWSSVSKRGFILQARDSTDFDLKGFVKRSREKHESLSDDVPSLNFD